MSVIGFLDRGTGGDRKIGTNSANCFDAGRDKVERALDTADSVVDCRLEAALTQLRGFDPGIRNLWLANA